MEIATSFHVRDSEKRISDGGCCGLCSYNATAYVLYSNNLVLKLTTFC